MIFPPFTPRAPLAAHVLERSPLAYAPSSTTTLNHERLNSADPNFYKLWLQFCDNNISSEEYRFLHRGLALKYIVLLGLVLNLAQALARYGGPGPILAVCLGTPLVVAALTLLVHRHVGQFWRNAGAGLALAVYALALSDVDAPIRELGVVLAYPVCAVFAGIALTAVSFKIRFAHAWPTNVYFRMSALWPFSTWSDRQKRLLHWCALAIAFAGSLLLITDFPSVLHRWVTSRVMLVTTNPALTMILAVLGSWFAYAGAALLPNLGWIFLVYDAEAQGAPGIWSPTHVSARDRRRLALVAVIAMHTVAGLMLGWNATTTSPPWLTSNVFANAIISSLCSSEFILCCLMPFALLMRVHQFCLRRSRLNNLSHSLNYALRTQHSPVTLQDCDGRTIREADHIYLGWEPFRRFPVMVHRPLLHEHGYIQGDSGSGKTSLGLIPLVANLIGTRNSRVSEDPAVVIFDLKGDKALFETARRFAWAAGKTFKHFTPELNRSSFHFNPFLDMEGQNRSMVQVAELLLDALALNHGEGYGRTYFSRRSRDLLLDALSEQPRAATFEDLLSTLQRLVQAQPAAYKDAFELMATIRALTCYPQLNVRPGTTPPEHTIHMPSVLAERQVVYFWLPSATESVSVREIGKLALYSLLSAAIARQPSSEEDRADDARFGPRRAYLVIDEFQRLVGENFKVVLEQARSFGIGVILANQSISELKTASADLRNTVRTNTRIKMHFSVQNPADLKELSEASGEDLVTHRGSAWTSPASLFSKADDMQTVTTSFAMKPRLTPSDLLAISDHPRRFVLQVSRGSGLTQFGGRAIPVETQYFMTALEYEESLRAPWPENPALPKSVAAPQAIDVQARHEIADKQRETVRRLFRDQTESAADPLAPALLAE